MISKNLEKAINVQIMNKERSSRIYMAMASWCETNALPGAAEWLYKQSDEERMHMLKFVKYLNDRGGYAILSKLDKPTPDFKNLHEIFEQVLKHEQFVTSEIHKLYELAMNEKDYSTENFLQWYISEQVEEESVANAILDKLKLVGNDKAGMFHIDKELAAQAAAKVIDTI